MSAAKIWNRLFLQERPTFSLGFFRVAAAVTTGCHVLPTFVPMADNYLPTAFKTFDTNFFTVDAVQWVQQSPEWVIYACVAIFIVSWLSFLIGFLSQVSCIVMTAMCYYFYALNSFHVGTLSWDILLVTLFLMCITPYHGDYFSIDGWLKKKRIKGFYLRRRPYFVQRLLQLQVGFSFFYTALYKITAEGNWLQDNPVYYLMLYPYQGVTKTFLLKDVLVHYPGICYVIGILIVALELSLIVWLFWRKTRVAAILLGWAFHIMLILTLDVPAIFFFLFPAQLLLFMDPRDLIRRIHSHQRNNKFFRRGFRCQIS